MTTACRASSTATGRGGSTQRRSPCPQAPYLTAAEPLALAHLHIPGAALDAVGAPDTAALAHPQPIRPLGDPADRSLRELHDRSVRTTGECPAGHGRRDAHSVDARVEGDGVAGSFTGEALPARCSSGEVRIPCTGTGQIRFLVAADPAKGCLEPETSSGHLVMRQALISVWVGRDRTESLARPHAKHTNSGSRSGWRRRGGRGSSRPRAALVAQPVAHRGPYPHATSMPDRTHGVHAVGGSGGAIPLPHKPGEMFKVSEPCEKY